MATWPSNLIVMRGGYSETPPTNTIRSQMEIGPDKVRKRTTTSPRKIQFGLFLTDALVDTLDDFYVANESLRFDFTDPRTSATVKARFLSPPSYSYKETMWEVSVELEILP